MSTKEGKVGLDDCISCLGDPTSKKSDKVKAAKCIKSIVLKKGLSTSDIVRVVKICTGSTVKYMTVKRELADSLMTESYIPEEAAVCVILKVISGKCGGALAKKLLLWLDSGFKSTEVTSKLVVLVSSMLCLFDSHALGAAAKKLAESILNSCKGSVSIRPEVVCILGLDAAKFGKQMFSLEFVKILKKQVAYLQRIKFRTLSHCDSHIVALSPLEATKSHAELFLNEYLFRALFGSNRASDQKELKTFFMVKELVTSTEPVWIKYLTVYLSTWDLNENEDIVMTFLSYLPVVTSVVIKERILNGLKKALISSPNVNLKCRIVDGLQDMVLRHIISASNSKRTEEVERMELFVIEIWTFVEEVVLECSTIMHHDQILSYALMDFWESISLALQKYNVSIPILPEEYFIGKAVFGVSGVCLDKACRTITTLSRIASKNSGPMAVTLQNHSDCIRGTLNPSSRVWDFPTIKKWANRELMLIDVVTSEQQLEGFAFDKHPCFAAPLVEMRIKAKRNFSLAEFLHHLKNDGYAGVCEIADL